MYKFALAILCFAAATPLAAEDWQILEVFGDSPTRSITLLDRDAIDLTDRQRPIIRNAVLYETAMANGAARLIVTQKIDCKAATYTVLNVEGRDFDGEVIANQRGGDSKQIERDSVIDIYREAACENRWDLFTPSADGKTLGEIASETFGWWD